MSSETLDARIYASAATDASATCAAQAARARQRICATLYAHAERGRSEGTVFAAICLICKISVNRARHDEVAAAAMVRRRRRCDTAEERAAGQRWY